MSIVKNIDEIETRYKSVLLISNEFTPTQFKILVAAFREGMKEAIIEDRLPPANQ